MGRIFPEVDEGAIFWTIARSPLDGAVWVPFGTGWGDVNQSENAGSLRRVKAYCERTEWVDDARWVQQDADTWVALNPEEEA